MKESFIIKDKKLFFYGDFDKAEVVVPNGIDVIVSAAFFAHREIKRIILPEGLKSIGRFAFAECVNIVRIDLPASLVNLADDAFDGCLSLEEIKISNNDRFVSEDGVLYSFDRQKIIKVPSNYKASQFIIPCQVQEIGSTAFNRTQQIYSVVIPDSVKKIGYKSFCYCKNLKNIHITANVKEIGYCAFSNCVNLEIIDVSKRNENYRVKDGILYDFACRRVVQLPSGYKCKDITIDKNVEKIEDRALTNNMYLENIEVADNDWYSAESGVLFDKKFETLIAYPCGKGGVYKIPDSVVEIGGSAFQGARKIFKVVLGKGVEKISRHAFEHSALAYLKPNERLKKIGWFSFSYCDMLKKLDFSATQLDHINGGAFSFCSNLKAIKIPSTVNSIIRWAFLECNNLKKITIAGDISRILFDGVRFSIMVDELDKLY